MKIYLLLSRTGNLGCYKEKMKRSDHFHLVKYDLEDRTILTKTDVIIFHVSEKTGLLTPDYAHSSSSGGRLFNLGLKPHEKAFILNIKTLYTHNDFMDSVILECVLFPEESCTLVIPGNGFRGVVDPSSNLVYEPNMINLDINLFPYIGMEQHILNKKSTCVTPEGIDSKSYDAFRFTDPLIVFLLQYRHKFDTLRSDDIIQLKDDNTIYLVKKSLVERVQLLFKNAIFPLFKYKTENEFELKVKEPGVTKGLQNMFVMAQVQIDYIKIAPRMATYEIEGIKLKL